MVWIVLVAIVLLLLAVIAIKLKEQAGHSVGFPYSKKPVLFSPAERSFLGILEQAVGNEYLIFGKVRVADIVEPKRVNRAGVGPW